jgi:hypothetical protein
MTESAGQQFGKYRIESELGRGGFGAVFQAVDTTLDRTVALKILDPMLMRDANWVMNFRKEARVMAKLEHPHIVPFYETGEEDGRLYIAMKLIEGGNLAAYIQKNSPLPWEETVRILQEVAAALDFAHERQVAHRDLKPGNVLLGSNGTVVLTDFGFAKLVSDNSMSVSISGGIVGTPAYIAPEVWEGKTVDKRADIYALGCILYEMATSQALFQGDSPPAIMLAHFQPPPIPQSWPAGIPVGIKDVLQIALSRDPAARYGNAGEMARDLLRLTADKLAEPYAQVEAALAAQQWEQALTLAAVIKGQNAQYRDIGALEEKAITGQEREQRAAWAAQWRQQAEASLAIGNLDVARTAALRWQEMTPDDKQVKTFLANLTQAAKPAASEKPPQKVVPVIQKTEVKPTPSAVQPPQVITQEATKAPAPQTNFLGMKKPESVAALGAQTNWKRWGVALGGLAIIGIIGIIVIVGLTVSNWGSEPPVSGHLVEEWLREKDGMVMVYVPPPNTPFIQGSGLTAPTPGFWIDKYEVTNSQYQLCVNAGVCRPSLYANDNRFNGANHPVVGVSWHDAAAYATWVGGALPTEEEWEYAAAGEARREYPWGDQFDGKRLNFCDTNCRNEWKDSGWNDGYSYTAPVGSYPNGESWVGAADMAGNVGEWTDSWYDEAQTWRVLRGGSFSGRSNHARAAARNNATPDYRASLIGFRVVVVRRPPSP